jgi:hypothetical protein
LFQWNPSTVFPERDSSIAIRLGQVPIHRKHLPEDGSAAQRIKTEPLLQAESERSSEGFSNSQSALRAAKSKTRGMTVEETVRGSGGGDAATAPTNFLTHPVTRLVAVTLTLTGMLHLVFFHFAKQIWAMQEDIPLQAVTSWSRWAMLDRDGVEPQVLLLLTLVLCVLTVLGMQWLKHAPRLLHMVLMTACLMFGVIFVVGVPLQAPLAQTARLWRYVLVVEAGIFLAALVARWATRQRGLHFILAAALVPVCFLEASLPSHADLSCILAPALKLRLGFSPAQIYMQYDYLLALLAVGWHWIGGEPFAFSRVTQGSYYLLLVASFLLARRMFQEQRLAGMLLVALCVVRIYSIPGDANVWPQTTPLRLDLWILLLAPALVLGLRHWSVGLVAGLIYFFARSFGILYLGSYALALSVDFLLRHFDAEEHIPFWREIAAYARPMAAGLVFVGAGLLAARWVFGNQVSDALLTYQRLRLGMMRITPESFYWWIAPALAATGWLAFSLRGVIGQRRAGASIFLLTLSIGNSIYFFGRSHEGNLLNISAPLLFTVFLGMDLAILAWQAGPVWVHRCVHAAPWLALAIVGFFYSGQIVEKIHTQFEWAARRQALPEHDQTGTIDCQEIAAVAKDSRVFVYDLADYWFYEQCGYVPPGYVQPILLQPLRAKLVEQLNQLLNARYKIIVPKVHADGIDFPFDFSDVESSLAGMERTETAHYDVYYRK